MLTEDGEVIGRRIRPTPQRLNVAVSRAEALRSWWARLPCWLRGQVDRGDEASEPAVSA